MCDHNLLDLVDKDAGRGPGDAGFVLVYSIHEQCSATGNVVDGVIHNRFNASTFGDHIEAV